MNIDSIIRSGTPSIDYIVIDDGQFQFPVLRADVARSGETRASIRDMDEDAYAAWCGAVPAVLAPGDSVGSQTCIDMCRALEALGAQRWHVAQ